MKRSAHMALALAAAALSAVPAANPVETRTATEVRAPSERQQPAQRTTSPAIARAVRESFGGWGINGSRGWQRRRGPGWTQAQVQRMARKKRNQARHRKACR
jgi:hypothetical protein